MQRASIFRHCQDPRHSLRKQQNTCCVHVHALTFAQHTLDHVHATGHGGQGRGGGVACFQPVDRGRMQLRCCLQKKNLYFRLSIASFLNSAGQAAQEEEGLRPGTWSGRLHRPVGARTVSISLACATAELRGLFPLNLAQEDVLKTARSAATITIKSSEHVARISTTKVKLTI